mmetsp:Transcript_14419/g.24594  ORF Transcript_14419/g.24594 Transcript_14419/m.24594 type:complete len:263 (+) Transcript_14419:1074-1862(+)
MLLGRKRASSVFTDNSTKVKSFKLPADSASMTFAACLKKELNGGIDVDEEQIAYVFQNSFFINLLQLSLVFLIWYYAIFNGNFAIMQPDGLDILCARFIASMMMHLNIEKDVRNGISMMKYCVNHPANFKNVHVAFLISFLLTVSSLLIEFTVMLVLISLPNVLEVIMKYVSLAAIANVPRFYFNSLVDHKLLKCAGLVIPITNFRRDDPRKHAHWSLKLMRVLHKSLRIFFCSWSYYFLPFSTMFVTYFISEGQKSKAPAL